MKKKEQRGAICTCSKNLQYCDNSCRDSEVLEGPQQCCRICDGPCKGEDTHEATRKSWINQEPRTVTNQYQYGQRR